MNMKTQLIWLVWGGEKIVITKCMNEMIKWPSLLISINEWTRTKGNKWKWKSACTMNHNIINNNNEKPKTYQRLQSSSDWIRVIKKKKTQIHRWSDRSLLAFASHQGAVLFIESTNKTQNDKKTTTNKKILVNERRTADTHPIDTDNNKWLLFWWPFSHGIFSNRKAKPNAQMVYNTDG